MCVVRNQNLSWYKMSFTTGRTPSMGGEQECSFKLTRGVVVHGEMGILLIYGPCCECENYYYFF